MKNRMMVSTSALVLAFSVLSFADEKKYPAPNMSEYEHAFENAKFKRGRDVFNNSANIEKRSKWLFEREAEEAKRRADEAQDKGEGPFKVKF